MSHLTATEFVDLLDGTLDKSRMRHLDACAMCRTQMEDLGGALVSGLSVDQPEPSPLFWESFPGRVSASIGGSPVEDGRWSSWILSPRALAAGAVLIVLVLIGTSWRQQVADRREAVAIVEGDPLLEPTEPESEEGWAAVRAAAEGLVWEQVHDAGLSTRPGQAERAVINLTDTERARLIALLEEDLKKAGD